MSTNENTENPQNSAQANNDNDQSIQSDTAEEQSSAEQTSIFGDVLNRDWLDQFIAPGIVTIVASLLTLIVQNFYNSQTEANRYHQELANDYIESIQELLFDKYLNTQKIPVDEEIANFVKSKTSNTIKSLKYSPEQRGRLIDFLRLTAVGFAPLKKDFPKLPEDICEQQVSTQTRDYSHFLCKINLNDTNLDDKDLSYGVFQDGKFHRASLNNVDLFNSYLDKAFLLQAQLQNASLINARLTYAYLIGANFKGANLIGANLEGAILSGVNFKGANLIGVNLEGAILTSARCSDLELNRLRTWICDKFTGGLPTKLINVNFLDNRELPPGDVPSRASFRQTLMGNTDLSGTDLSNADLRGAILTDIKFNNATKFDGALFDSKTKLPFDEDQAKKYKMLKIAPYVDLEGSNLKGANLRSTNLKGADLSGADLTKADLRGANLTETKFHKFKVVGTSNTNFKSVELRDVWLNNTTFKIADIRFVKPNRKSLISFFNKDVFSLFDEDIFKNALFNDKTKLPFDEEQAKKNKMLKIAPGADLKGANLRGTDLSKTNLSGANLREADLEKSTDLRGANLSKADLQGARLPNIRFDDETNFKKALFNDETKLPFGKETARKKYRMLYISPGADLRGADLTGADLRNADLKKADLRGANLADIKFNNADFEGALFDLSTNLPFDEEQAKRVHGMLKVAPGEVLIQADLTGFDLRGIDLTSADLNGADLTDANLTDADLTDANLTNAVLTDAQLALAKLCRTIKHKDQDKERILGKYCL